MPTPVQSPPTPNPPPAAHDATLDFASALSDPTRWIVKKGVPVFKPHERTDPNTGALIKVDLPKLYRIAQNMQRLERAGGVPIRMTLGHTEPGKPETQQPPMAGYYRNARVERFGPKGEPAIVVDEWLDPQYAPLRKNYPYRSSEYYDDAEQITGVALLTRDPFLDLGMVAYTRPCPGPVRYGRSGREAAYVYTFGDDAVDNQTTPGPVPVAPQTGIPTVQPAVPAPQPTPYSHPWPGPAYVQSPMAQHHPSGGAVYGPHGYGPDMGMDMGYGPYGHHGYGPPGDHQHGVPRPTPPNPHTARPQPNDPHGFMTSFLESRPVSPPSHGGVSMRGPGPNDVLPRRGMYGPAGRARYANEPDPSSGSPSSAGSMGSMGSAGSAPSMGSAGSRSSASAGPGSGPSSPSMGGVGGPSPTGPAGPSAAGGPGGSPLQVVHDCLVKAVEALDQMVGGGDPMTGMPPPQIPPQSPFPGMACPPSPGGPAGYGPQRRPAPRPRAGYYARQQTPTPANPMNPTTPNTLSGLPVGYLAERERLNYQLAEQQRAINMLMYERDQSDTEWCMAEIRRLAAAGYDVGDYEFQQLKATPRDKRHDYLNHVAAKYQRVPTARPPVGYGDPTPGPVPDANRPATQDEMEAALKLSAGSTDPNAYHQALMYVRSNGAAAPGLHNRLVGAPGAPAPADAPQSAANPFGNPYEANGTGY